LPYGHFRKPQSQLKEKSREMLSFKDFFVACTGVWTTERTYHFATEKKIERSYTEYQVQPLTATDKKQILEISESAKLQLRNPATDFAALIADQDSLPGFAIAFNTRSETGETVSMSLQALFVADSLVVSADTANLTPRLPIAAQVPAEPEGEIIQGFYLRNEGYSEAGAIAGRFTYQPTRQTLEMTTFYNRSVAVDQMRFIAPNVRLRTIVTYQRPQPNEIPSVIDLIGFGVEHKQLA
jgi:hypothetical protein